MIRLLRAPALVSLLAFGLSCAPRDELAPREIAGKPNSIGSDREYDIVIYGATSGGIAAAIQARRMGKEVVLIEPSSHIGGLTTGGLGATDIGNKRAIGGISREFYRRVAAHYAKPDSWVHESPEAYRSGRGVDRDPDTMWTFEPKVATAIYRAMLVEAEVELVERERLDRDGGVTKDDGRIRSIRLESGREIRGRIFIDATYEGDLFAAAGVSYHVGREANATYGETLNGVQTRNATKHQFLHDVDPYVVRGDPSSGLLPEIHDGGPGDEGAGDHRVQAYCFRMCLTDAPENRLPIPKPESYDARRYELLLRYFEAGFDEVPWHNVRMPNRKTDINNNHAFSTDHIGANYGYPDGSYEEREAIVREHLEYQLGLLWCLANEERVPEAVRAEVRRWGLPKDEYTDSGHWTPQIYVREARRLVGDRVMTQHHCQGREIAPEPIGLAAYTMDSHNVQRHVVSGVARNEGDVQVGGFPPYPIAYRSLLPKRAECRNLLVPVSLSASHIAFGSIRMEPVFMVLGQSAATAAALALDEGVDLHDLDYSKLRDRLLADGQVLEWTPEPRAGVDPKDLEGIIVDDTRATLEGTWHRSLSVVPFIASGYLHDAAEKSTLARATFRAEIPERGRWEVSIAYSPHPNRDGAVPVTIRAGSESRAVRVDQRTGTSAAEPFRVVGTFEIAQGETAEVVISNEGTTGHVIADGVRFRRVD